MKEKGKKTGDGRKKKKVWKEGRESKGEKGVCTWADESAVKTVTIWQLEFNFKFRSSSLRT